jgi:hypothetical protein
VAIDVLSLLFTWLVKARYVAAVRDGNRCRP